MKIHYCSDIHYDVEDSGVVNLAGTGADVIVLAGDIAEATPESFEWILEKTDGVPTILVFGNHEYYRNDIPEVLGQWKELTAGTNIHLLDGESVVIDGIRFIGATLWTDYSFYGEDSQELSMNTAFCLSDHRVIRYEGELFTPDIALELHHQHREVIAKELAKGDRAVVVTHHAPTPLSINPEFEGHPLNPAFCSDLSSLIEHYQPVAWIHGHLHHRIDARVGETRILCNPVGYPDEWGKSGFEAAAFFEI